MTLKQFFESKEKLVINCKSEEEANTFCKFAHKLGYSWKAGNSYESCNYWYDFMQNTCYSNYGSYCHILHFKAKNIKVLNFEDIDWSEEKNEKNNS